MRSKAGIMNITSITRTGTYVQISLRLIKPYLISYLQNKMYPEFFLLTKFDDQKYVNNGPVFGINGQ